MKAWLALAGVVSTTLALPAAAKEYYVGGPLHEHDMEIVANYLIGIEMAPMTPQMAMGADVIHLEADIHARRTTSMGIRTGAGYLISRWSTRWRSRAPAGNRLAR